MFVHRKNATKRLITFLVVGLLFAIFASSASGTTPENGRAHSEVTSVAFKVVKQEGWIGVQEHIRIQKVPKSQCKWFKTFYNSNYLLGQTNHVPQMYIDHNGYLCRDKYSPTGWVKRGGGHTGSDCGNIAAPPNVKMPVRKPPVIEVSSSSHVKVKVKIEVHAVATITLPCGTATGTGFAYDLIEVNYKTYIKAKHSQSLKLKLAAKVIVEAKDRAEATAEVQCNSSTSSPPPSSTESLVLNNLDTVNDMEVNRHRPICVDVYPPVGETIYDLTIKFKATYGHFTGSLEYKGPNRVCDTYNTPSEVPSGGQEIYSVFAKDSKGNTAESETKTFPIKPETSFE